MQKLEVGTPLKLAKHGVAAVTKIYTHPETREVVADVRCMDGTIMHLSLAYASKRVRK